MKFLIPFLFFTNFLFFFGEVIQFRTTGKGFNKQGKLPWGKPEFTFALQDKDGKVRWRNGTDGEKKIRVQVFNGRYTVLLGGQGMNVLPPQLFTGL